MAKTRRAAFRAEHGTPRPKGELVVGSNAADGTLISLIDLDNPHPRPVDIPERVVSAEDETTEQEAIVKALAGVMKAFNMRGRNKGRDDISHTGGNKFITRYKHPIEESEWMDGKEIRFTDDSLADLDILNRTADRLQAGESEEAVIQSRNRIAAQLERKFGPGAMQQVEPYSSIEVPVTARDRKKLLANSEAVQHLVSSLRLGSI